MTVCNLFARVLPLPRAGGSHVYKIAGIDVHKKVLMVVVVDASTPEEKPERRRFATLPSELRRLSIWLREQGEEAVESASLAPTVNHCSAHGTWSHANDRRSNHTPLPKRLTSVARRSVSGCRNGSAKTSSFPLCPDHRPGPTLMSARPGPRRGS